MSAEVLRRGVPDTVEEQGRDQHHESKVRKGTVEINGSKKSQREGHFMCGLVEREKWLVTEGLEGHFMRSESVV